MTEPEDRWVGVMYQGQEPKERWIGMTKVRMRWIKTMSLKLDSYTGVIKVWGRFESDFMESE